MRFLTLMIFCVCSYFGFTQSTLIEFNYHDESYTFYKITKKGDTIKKKQPFSYRNVPVKVVVKDLNTYFYDVTFARLWVAETGETRYTQSFSDRHLDALIRVASDARDFIAEKKSHAETVTIAA